MKPQLCWVIAPENTFYFFKQRFHLLPRLAYVLFREAAFHDQRIALNEIETGDLLTNAAKGFQCRVISERLIEKRLQIVNAVKLPAL